MKTLRQVLEFIPHRLVQGDYEKKLSGVQIDSRSISENNLFIAISGAVSDGHQFIGVAIEKGATVIICQQEPGKSIPTEIAVVMVDDSKRIAGLVAANFYDQPSQKLQLIGVTGTNGKTSIVQLLHKLFTDLGHKAGLLSTIENKIGEEVSPSSLTTPDAVSLQKMLAEMVAYKCSYAFMEVSSHALTQHRVAGCVFKVAAFTNITHDHLDYHGTFDQYIKAKKSFFDQLQEGSQALINIDDRHGMVMTQNTKATVSTYALRKAADYKGKVQDNSPQGLQLLIDGTEIHSQLVGAFNASNLLAVYAIARLLDQDQLDVLRGITALAPPPGRMEVIRDVQRNITAFVDYAHTPDALKNVLETIAEIKRTGQTVVTVIGCGGNRDAGKRPIMAQIAVQFSDRVILTSDNPRDEDPEQIIRDMESGIPPDSRQHVVSIENRKEAIKVASALTSPGGILLIAGKGHETYQEINGVRHPFDDRLIIKSLFTQNKPEVEH